MIVDGRSSDKSPQVGVEAAEFGLDGEGKLGVENRRFDLEAVADDPGIREQALDFGGAETGDLRDFEVGKSPVIGIALFQDGDPAQAGLRAFEDQEFEQFAIVVQRDAPLLVVVGDFDGGLGPGTSGFGRALGESFE